MKIVHHPDISTLMSYAAGSLPEALAAVVASHASFCPDCAAEVRRCEVVGAALFERLPPATLSTGIAMAGSAVQSALRSSAELTHGRRTMPAAGELPAPLGKLLGVSRVDEIEWRRLGLGVWHVPLSISDDAEGDLRLIKVAPGVAVPEHGHGGAELTLILEGAYSDELGTYATGDVADLDDEVEHSPVADPHAGCICLIASEKRARFKGLLPRLVQPLTGL